jgi:lysozyme
MNYSAQGLELTKQFEGCRLTAYQDQGGVWTIGYGATINTDGTPVKAGEVITQEEADYMLMDNISSSVDCVNKQITNVNQNQFDALVDFAYNVGCNAFTRSTLCSLVKLGEFENAAAEFGKYIYAKDKISTGLIRRREAEANLFLAV